MDNIANYYRTIIKPCDGRQDHQPLRAWVRPNWPKTVAATAWPRLSCGMPEAADVSMNNSVNYFISGLPEYRPVKNNG